MGKFKSTHNATDSVAEKQVTTFFALLKLADLTSTVKKKIEKPPEEILPEKGKKEHADEMPLSLRYNIEIHLPATKDVDVYNAIFKSLKAHLLE